MLTLKKHSLMASVFLTVLMAFSFSLAHAQIPHSVLGMVRNNDSTVPATEHIKFLVYIKNVSDGGVHSETRSSDDTGNAYGNGVMGEGWFELECANFSQFEWATGDSLRLAIANTNDNQLLTTSILLNAAVEPQLTETIDLCPFLENMTGWGDEDHITVEWFLDEDAPQPPFNIFRSTAELGPYQKLNVDPIVADQPHQCSYCDLQVSSGITYWYKLGLAEFSDSLALFGPISVTIRTGVAGENEFAGPTDYQLSQNFPNPFNPETTSKYQVPKTCPVSVGGYNLLGQRVRTLVEETKPPGYHQVIWNGRDNGGNTVASGVYFYHLIAGSYAETKKMTLLK